MKICLLTYRGNMYCGGQGIYLYYLSREFLRLGHQVTVIAGPPYPDVPEGANLIKLRSSSVYLLRELGVRNSFHFYNPLDLYEFTATYFGIFSEPFAFSLRAYFKLRELMQKDRFDIIHDNQSLGYGLLLMKSLKVPVVATIHHPLPIDRAEDLAQARGLLERWQRRKFYAFVLMQSFVSKRLERVITVSLSSAQEIIRHFKVAKERLRVIYNGVDTKIFSKRDGVAKEPHSLIMVGNTEDRKKGVLYLLKALQLLKNDTNVRLTIIDPRFSHATYAPRLIKEYGLDGMVTFTGPVSTQELVQYYTKAEIAIAPSLFEGFGFPVAEAMACEVPVIASKVGAIPELVVNGETGILVPQGDAQALAIEIKRLLVDESLRRRMGKAARKRVEQYFSWEQAAKKILEVYQELL